MCGLAAGSGNTLGEVEPLVPFQIDGNFGATAGVCEMLLQSHLGEIHLLPALPAAWSNGTVRGLRARGGFEVDINWKDGRLTAAAIRGPGRSACNVRYGERTVNSRLPPAGSLLLNAELERR